MTWICNVLSQYSTLDISKLILLVSRADYTGNFSVNLGLVASHMYFHMFVAIGLQTPSRPKGTVLMSELTNTTKVPGSARSRHRSGGSRGRHEDGRKSPYSLQSSPRRPSPSPKRSPRHGQDVKSRKSPQRPRKSPNKTPDRRHSERSRNEFEETHERKRSSRKHSPSYERSRRRSFTPEDYYRDVKSPKSSKNYRPRSRSTRDQDKPRRDSPDEMEKYRHRKHYNRHGDAEFTDSPTTESAEEQFRRSPSRKYSRKHCDDSGDRDERLSRDEDRMNRIRDSEGKYCPDFFYLFL